jgi:hypothetical protein
VPANNGMEISYYKWIYDRSRLILAKKPINLKNGAFFKLYYYDVDSKSKVEIFNEVNNKSIKIPINNINEKINSVDMSNLTNVIYVKLWSSNNYSRVYSINIMAQEKSINTVTHNIGKIISTQKDDVLLYENLSNRKVYRNGSNSAISIDGKSNLSLIGIDNNDNVYLALADNNKTKLIYFGNISNESWKKVEMNTEEVINKIYVNFKGQIFVQDSSKSIIKELVTGKGTYYNGEIIGMYDNEIISEKNSEITKATFN